MKRHAILIPTYNSVSTLAETLQSVLAQADLSVLDGVYLADDGSTDATGELARRVWQSDTPIVLIHNEHVGQWGNVNAAIGRLPPQIEWVHILHSDDLAKPHWLATMVDQAENGASTIGSICSSWDNLNGDGSIEAGENEPSKATVHVDASAEAIRSTLRKGCWWHISGCAIRVKAFRDVGGFSEDFPQSGDWQWLLRSMERGWGVDYIPQTLIVYRQHAASVSSTSFREHRDVVEAFAIIRRFARYLTFEDVCRLYASRAFALMLRIARSLMNRNLTRARKALVLLFSVPASMTGALASRHSVGAELSGKH